MGSNKYVGDDVQPEALFGDNLDRLRDLKKKYDAYNTFRKWNMIKTSDTSA
jgi:hypothetical protein